MHGSSGSAGKLPPPPPPPPGAPATASASEAKATTGPAAPLPAAARRDPERRRRKSTAARRPEQRIADQSIGLALSRTSRRVVVKFACLGVGSFDWLRPLRANVNA